MARLKELEDESRQKMLGYRLSFESAHAKVAERFITLPYSLPESFLHRQLLEVMAFLRMARHTIQNCPQHLSSV